MKLSAMLFLCALGGYLHADPYEARVERLVALTRAMPDVTPERAEAAARSALEVETQRAPAPILLAIAWGESRFDPTVKTGHVCGPMQTVPTYSGDCERWSNMLEGFRAGRDELEAELIHDRRVHGDLRLALLAYACGNAAFDGTCTKMAYPAIVFARARALGWRPRSATTPGS